MTQFSIRIAIFMCVLLTMSQFSASMTRFQRNDAAVADALQYLQKLDNFYSQISRPRLVTRSEIPLEDSNHPELQTAIELLRLETLDRIYSKHSRPRFGKRNGLLKLMKDDTKDDEESEWQPKFFTQR